MIEVSEWVGSREFSTQLERYGVVIVKENGRERTRVTLNEALAALTQERHDDEDILEVTIEDLLRALIHQYARAG